MFSLSLSWYIRLLQVKDLAAEESENSSSCFGSLDRIIAEANLVKTALGSSLPLSWSGESDRLYNEVSDFGLEKVDFVSAAGFEMVELLIFAAHLLKDQISRDHQESRRNGDVETSAG